MHVVFKLFEIKKNFQKIIEAMKNQSIAMQTSGTGFHPQLTLQWKERE